MVTALAIPTHRPDDLAMLRALSSRPGRPGFCTTLLRALEQLHPSIYGQIDTLRFDLHAANDLAQAAVTPVVRRPYANLGGGKYAIALGDVHVTVDPLVAQGANIGSYSAFALADAIAEANVFDLAFCHEVERSRSARILGAAHWTNAFLQPPDEARMELMAAMKLRPATGGRVRRQLQLSRAPVAANWLHRRNWRWLAESRARTHELARA